MFGFENEQQDVSNICSIKMTNHTHTNYGQIDKNVCLIKITSFFMFYEGISYKTM